MAHTKTPWAFQSYAGQDYGIYGESENNDLAIVRGTGNDNGDCNAAHIVRCVNSHDALVDALERSLNWLSSYPGGGTMGAGGPYEQARAALALAKSE